MTTRRAGLYVLLLAVAAYLNSLGNGFAYDDNAVIVQNPAVVTGNLAEALTSPYWPDPIEGSGLYRPVTSGTLALEWMAFGDSPFGYHAVNVLLHGMVSLLIFLLILEVGSLPGALVGAGLFAIHPVHTEAVANVVGVAELLSGGAFLLACLVYLRSGRWGPSGRALRLVAVSGLYLVSLGAKEIGVTLPGVLLLLEAFYGREIGGRADPSSGETPSQFRGVYADAPLYVSLALVLGGYLLARTEAIGTLLGEVPAPVFLSLSSLERVYTALAIVPEFLRLSLLPLSLSADYAPGVLFPALSVDGRVILGILSLVVLGLLAVRTYPTNRLVSLGIVWFGLTALPVSNLLFPTGVLLAERTLYLPSVGVALVVAGLTPWAMGASRKLRPVVLAGAVIVFLGFFVRTVLRNPAWMSTWVVLETLNQEHPESYLSVRARGSGLDRVGEREAAREAFDMAVALVPDHYGMLVEVGEFKGRNGDWSGAEQLLRRAVAIVPGRANAYQILGAQLLRREQGREAHRLVLEGLARAGSDRELWALLSESYVMKGDLPAAVRARRAALGADPASAFQWSRLGELLSAMGDEAGAASAQAAANALSQGSGTGRGSP